MQISSAYRLHDRVRLVRWRYRQRALGSAKDFAFSLIDGTR
jgi:hypothetical protein